MNDSLTFFVFLKLVKHKIILLINSLICPKIKSATLCTVSLNYSESIKINIGPWDMDDHSVDPSPHLIILKIVGFQESK